MSYLLRIQNAYERLSESRIVKEQEVTNDSLTYFQATINNTIPSNENEEMVRTAVYNLFKGNPNSFTHCSQNNKEYILLTDARKIADHFKITNVVYIKWNPVDKKYIIEKKRTKNPTKNPVKTSTAGNPPKKPYQKPYQKHSPKKPYQKHSPKKPYQKYSPKKPYQKPAETFDDYKPSKKSWADMLDDM